MKRYQEFATDLDQLLDGVSAIRITVPGHMPLSVEGDWIQWRRTPIGVALPIR